MPIISQHVGQTINMDAIKKVVKEVNNEFTEHAISSLLRLPEAEGQAVIDKFFNGISKDYLSEDVYDDDGRTVEHLSVAIDSMAALVLASHAAAMQEELHSRSILHLSTRTTQQALLELAISNIGSSDPFMDGKQHKQSLLHKMGDILKDGISVK